MERRVCELLAEACQTFTHPKRVEIINLLRGGEKSVGELVAELGASKANVSQHLAILRQRGAVAYRREGQTLYYRLANPKIIKACDLMKEVLMERLAEGERLAEQVGGGRRRR